MIKNQNNIHSFMRKRSVFWPPRPIKRTDVLSGLPRSLVNVAVGLIYAFGDAIYFQGEGDKVSIKQIKVTQNDHWTVSSSAVTASYSTIQQGTE